jgi:hypothetical protein
MTDGIVAGNGACVERSVVAAGPPTVVVLGDDVSGRWPGTLGATSRAVPQHGVEFGFSDSEPVWCQSTWPAGDWWAWCSPDVVDSAVAYLALDSGGAREVRERGE